MKNTFFLILLCLAYVQAGKAQNSAIQWASTVLYMDSEWADIYTEKKPPYKAIQALGKPNSKMGRSSPCAYSPAFQGERKTQKIILGFAETIAMKAIVINENNDMGSFQEISVGYLDDITKKIKKTENLEKTNIYKNSTPLVQKGKGQLFTLELPNPIARVNFVEIIFQFKKGEFPQIDAVGILQALPIPAITINAFKFENVAVERLSDAVNTVHQEVAPYVSNDGKTLYFTRSNHPENTGILKKQDVWFAELGDSSQFKKAKNMGSLINNDLHNSSFNDFAKGEKLLINNVYLKDDAGMERGVSITTKVNNAWILPRKVVIRDFYNLSSFSEFFMTEDAKILLMTSELNDTNGGKDIYVSFKKSENEYTTPKNIGNTVNTAANETSPFLSANGKVLIFSTSGHLGFGSNDCFLSYRLDDSWEKWSEPINLGAWINSQEWEGYFSMTAAGDYFYFCSYHNSIGESDIFRVKTTKKMRQALLGE